MRISYDPAVDALYIPFTDDKVECEVLRINHRVALNICPGEKLVGLEVLDASEVLEGLDERTVHLDNLTAAS